MQKTKLTNAQKLLLAAFERYKKKKGRDFSITQLSKDIKKPYSTIYNPLMCGRQCNAQTFLDLLTFFGCKAIEGDKLDKARY